MQNLIENQVSEKQVLTTDELATLLQGITKSTIVNVIYQVDDTRSKQVKGIKQVQKKCQITHVYLNHDYTKKVQKLTNDDSFIPMELKGKTRISSTLLQSDKTNELMLDGKILNSETIKILAYYHNGIEITEIDAIAKDLWANAYYTPTEKQTMGRGSVSIEDDFNIINPYLSRIKEIKINGTWYEII